MKKIYCYLLFLSLSLLLFLMYGHLSETHTGGGGGGDHSLPYNYPHPVETLQDSLPYKYYDTSTIYQAWEEEDTAKAITSLENSVVAQVKDLVLPHTLPPPTLISGRYRWLPDGLEHDLIYKPSSSLGTTRVTLFQKLNAPQVVRRTTVNETKPVHIIISLKGRRDKYTTFLRHITTSVLPHDHHITLTIAHFNHHTHHTLHNLTSAAFASYPNFKWTLLPLGNTQGATTGDEGTPGTTGVFSRGFGLHQGAIYTTKEAADVIFFCDVDVMINPEFFTRCRANTVLGRQVYYPMVFSLYNPELVYPIMDEPVPPIPQQLKVTPDTGFWRKFGYGMSCVSRGDYLEAGGYPDIRVWGGEDEVLYERFLTKQHIKVIRAPDPALFHLHHSKQCTMDQAVVYPACLRSIAATQGSRLQLGLALLKTHKGTDIEGILSKRFYYFWLVPYFGGLLVLSILANVILATLLLMGARRAQSSKAV